MGARVLGALEEFHSKGLCKYLVGSSRRLFTGVSLSHLLSQPQGVFNGHEHPVALRPIVGGQTEVLSSKSQLCLHSG